jgi:beta-galactosidase/beta-glucuronidase
VIDQATFRSTAENSAILHFGAVDYHATVWLTDAAIERARQTFDGMIDRDGHHPSIIAWTLINENWGPHFRARCRNCPQGRERMPCQPSSVN